MMKNRKNSKGKPKTYKGKKVKVTVPDDLRGNPLEDALRESVSVEAIAAVAAHLMGATCKNPKVNRELRWLAELMVGMLGTEYPRLLEEVGL